MIVLCEDKSPVDTIHWDEWWKYKCNRIKEERKHLCSVDSTTDYEPCSAKFEEIFLDYCGNKERKAWDMQYLAYWIEPVIIMGSNWSDDEEEDTHMIEGDDEFEEER